ncbi:uncharacterized protein LOC130048784 [Ostrea edulis]|uniref:uncharacterized protein LOC130048784 n=1 Tax=Ostrea edulis TaxID=37623 RepID=UPI0024AEB9CA|nr:uncharacterized protein LOC130048784 [Ostrea edulis]
MAELWLASFHSRLLSKQETKSGKPRAEVIAVGEPPAEEGTLSATTRPSTPSMAEEGTPSATTGPSTPSTVSLSTPVRFRPCRPSEGVGLQSVIMKELIAQRQQQDAILKKLDVANQRIIILETLIRKGNCNTQTPS